MEKNKPKIEKNKTQLVKVCCTFVREMCHLDRKSCAVVFKWLGEQVRWNRCRTAKLRKWVTLLYSILAATVKLSHIISGKYLMYESDSRPFLFKSFCETVAVQGSNRWVTYSKGSRDTHTPALFRSKPAGAVHLVWFERIARPLVLRRTRMPSVSLLFHQGQPSPVVPSTH